MDEKIKKISLSLKTLTNQLKTKEVTGASSDANKNKLEKLIKELRAIKETMITTARSDRLKQSVQQAEELIKADKKSLIVEKPFLLKESAPLKPNELALFKTTLKSEVETYEKEVEGLEPMVGILSEKTMIEQGIKELKLLIENKVYKSVEELTKDFQIASISIKNDLVEIKEKILKAKVKHDRLALRDPISFHNFKLLLLHAGKNQKPRRKAALKIIYTLLYYGGFRINEIRTFGKTDLESLMETGKVKIFHSKTNTVGEYVFPKAGRTQLKSLAPEIHLIFEQSIYVLCSLRATKQGVWIPLTEKEFIRVVNKDMIETSTLFNLPGVFSSHSFRIGKITSLLSMNTPIQKVAQIIGHQSILSTQRYNRYVLNPSEIEAILDEAFEKEQNK